MRIVFLNSAGLLLTSFLLLLCLALALQDLDEVYWVTGRSEDEARAKAARKFNVDQAKIDLKQGACVFVIFFFFFASGRFMRDSRTCCVYCVIDRRCMLDHQHVSYFREN